MTEDGTKTIEQLTRDIAAFRNMILYYENRIIRKETAIAEIIASMQCGEDFEPVSVNATVDAERSVIEMVKLTVEGMNGETLKPQEFLDRCVKRFPSQAERLERGIHLAVFRLKETGLLEDFKQAIKRRNLDGSKPDGLPAH